ncbi:Transcriptional regulator sdnM [Apiospora aurea]|uniref:Transcriptional regulator sdnM n=1 Tax=Apiospora aurea TaxID=335848 RepID=A0ABR1QMY6_9PEZI
MESAKVIPLHGFDTMPVYTNMVLSLMLKYDKVLDPLILRDSLIELVSREGWCKLGSRLERNVLYLPIHTKPENGKLVYHVPAKFDEKTPAITFSHVTYDMDVEGHHLGCKIPTHHPDKPTVVADPAVFGPLARRADAPAGLADFIARALPQLELHVVSFRNATLVSVSFLHSLLDGMGLGSQGLFRGWMLVLQGRQAEIPPVCGFDEDLLKDLGKQPTEKHKHQGNRMGRFGMLWWVLKRAFQVFWYKEEGRIVCIPESFVRQLRQSALDELAAQAGGSAGDAKPWISEGDVLVAWWTRYATLHLRNEPDKTISISSAYNIRRVLSGNLLPAGHAYLSNASLGLFMLPQIRDIFSRPISWMAAQMRQSIVETGTKAQIKALVAEVMPDWTDMSTFRMYGDTGMHMIVFTNWTQAQFYQVDLSPAAVDYKKADPQGQQQQQQQQQQPVAPSFVSYRISSTVWPMRDNFCIIGKDSEGRYWLAGSLQKGLWAKIDNELQQGGVVGA